MVKAGAEAARWRRGTACSGKPGLTGGSSAPTPTLVLPELPGVTFRIGSGNAKDTTRKPGTHSWWPANQGWARWDRAFVTRFCAVPCLKARQVSASCFLPCPQRHWGCQPKQPRSCASPVPSTAMTRGSPRGWHRWWHLPGPPAHPSPPRAPQRHHPRGAKRPHELRMRRTAAPK